MRKNSLILGMIMVVVLTIIISCANATQVETVTVAPFDREVLVFDLNEEDKFSGSLSISGGANDDIKFWITNPFGNPIVDQGRVSQGTIFEFTAQESGAYTLNFDNTFSVFSEKTVSLSYDITEPAPRMIEIDSFFVMLVLLIASLVAVIIILVGVLHSRQKTQTTSRARIRDRPVKLAQSAT